MSLFEVLLRCSEEGVALRLHAGGLRRSHSASPALVALLKAHREALLPIVGSASWPWLSDPAFVLAEARCKCGGDPYEFSVLGEPVCEHPERPL